MKKVLLAMALGLCLATPLTASAAVCTAKSSHSKKKEARKRAKSEANRKCSPPHYKKQTKEAKIEWCRRQSGKWVCKAKAWAKN